MADMVTGAMVSLIPKLGKLLMEEYSLQTDVKKRIKALTLELECAQAAIGKVAKVPWDELDDQVKIWAREVRESSYDMEDFLDTFLVRVKSRDSTEQESSLKRLGEQVNNLIRKSKARHKISVGVKDIMEHLDELTKTCSRYKVNDIESRPSTASTLDPRVAAMYNNVKSLIGINESSDELISMLQPQERGDMSNAKPKMKTVSVVGVGGLGKTTLAKAVYETLTSDYDCKAFVSVGRKLDMNKVIQAILIELDEERYMKFDFAKLHFPYQFINELRDCLRDKRYFIVIDDIWDTVLWDTLKWAIDDDNNCGGRIIVTTRIWEVATKAGQVYKLKPLSNTSSRELFHTRISGDERKHIDYNESDEISDEILKRCGGIPLAIITMASLLTGKPRDIWSEIYKSIGFGCKNNNGEDSVTRILSFSFYDLPPYLRTCLLYFSAYPEDSVIPKDGLVWKWVAEGFVQEKQGKRLFETGERLFETGEGYLNDLINRSLIEPVEENIGSVHSVVTGYRVHDMVLDFICSISCRENFFTVVDDDQGTPLRSNVVRRLAYHNKAMGRHTRQVNHFNDTGKVRSFIAQVCVNESWAPFYSFKLLRVLAIKNSYSADVYRIRMEDLGHLVHLRYLSLINAHVDKIPQEMGALKFLQTLDLRMSDLVEMSSISNLPTQLLCLRIRSDAARDDAKVASVERLTSLEELLIHVCMNIEHFGESCLTRKWAVKDLGSLKELRMLTAWIFWDGEESKTDFLESLHHLHKLQHLEIQSYYQPIKSRKGSYTWNTATWGAAELVLPRHLRHLHVEDIFFSKLPHCINRSCLPILSHLHLELKHMDDQDMRVLGLLPELRYLSLGFSWSFTISNINDSDVVYFPKLVCFILLRSMILFVGNKEEETVSIHVWNGEDDIAMPSHESEDDDELRRSMPSVSDNELHMPSVSDDEQQRPRRQLPDGLLALSYYYLLAFFQHVVAFVKKWSSLKQVGQEAFTSNRGSDHGNEENAIAMASAPTDDENKQSSLCTRGAVVPCHFMPSLRELSFQAHGKAVLGDHRYYDHLGWEYLSCLRKIHVHIISERYHPDPEVDKVEAVLKRAADMHPKRPALNVGKSWHGSLR